MGIGLPGRVLGVIIGTLALSAPAAHAQRVISDYEASKLTLDALTSVPVVRHVAVRRVVFHAASRHERGMARNAMVRQVAYHPHAAAHVAGAHHRHHT